ncbi:MAG TPA: cytochrome b/b6 domain-containing protein [Thermodesulfobacteriota bacterium]|nr:cytochrome b/b6 domain-containing protein [Thermodesulfobacteriota bacterium]
MEKYTLYRIDDWVLLAFAAAALVFCSLHAARRAFRQPVPTDLLGSGAASHDGQIERHGLFQRIYHWSNAAAVLMLSFSGLMIYQPRQMPAVEEATSAWFSLHLWGVALLLAGIVAHMIYESFIAAGANPMALNRGEARRIWGTVKNFLGLSGDYPRSGKYHGGQILFHWGVAANLFLLILTGIVLWKPLRDLLPLSPFGLGWDFIFFSRVLHGLFSAALIACLVIHFYFALFIQKNWPEAKSMITGRISEKDDPASHSAGPE